MQTPGNGRSDWWRIVAAVGGAAALLAVVLVGSAGRVARSDADPQRAIPIASRAFPGAPWRVVGVTLEEGIRVVRVERGREYCLVVPDAERLVLWEDQGARQEAAAREAAGSAPLTPEAVRAAAWRFASDRFPGFTERAFRFVEPEGAAAGLTTVDLRERLLPDLDYARIQIRVLHRGEPRVCFYAAVGETPQPVPADLNEQRRRVRASLLRRLPLERWVGMPNISAWLLPDGRVHWIVDGQARRADLVGSVRAVIDGRSGAFVQELLLPPPAMPPRPHTRRPPGDPARLE